MFLKKIIIFTLVILLQFSSVYADDILKTHASMATEFSTLEIPEEIQFKTTENIKVFEGITIPEFSIVTAEVCQYQKEKRWHKSGFIICKLKEYRTETFEYPVDISDKDIYLVAQKYEKPNVKSAVILGSELVLATAASCFLPGIDVIYFFTKGAIKREKNPNWFKAGVSNAYDNSICWFWLKGKPIELEENDTVRLKSIDKEKAEKIRRKIVKKEKKSELKARKKELRRVRRELAERYSETD